MASYRNRVLATCCKHPPLHAKVLCLRNKSIILYLITLLHPIFAHAQNLAALDAKNGFKDAKFGMPLSHFKGMKLIYSSPSSGSKGYIRISDKKAIGDIPLTGITYYFFNNKLRSVHVRANIKFQPEILQTLEASYGPGNLTAHSAGSFYGYWETKNVILQFSEYYAGNKEVIAEFYSVTIMEEERKYEFSRRQRNDDLKTKKRQAGL